MNTNTKRRLFLGTAAAAAISLSAAAFAGPHCGKKGYKHGGKHGAKHGMHGGKYQGKRLERMASKLGLSDEQKTQIQSLMTNHRNAVKPLREKKMALKKVMRDLDPMAGDYQAKLAGVAERKAEIAKQMTLARGNKRQQMAQILTPEQRAMRKEMMENRMKYRHHKRRY